MRITLIINNLTFLVSHRLKVVEALIRNGYLVSVVCGGSLTAREHDAEILLRALGVNIFRTPLNSRSKNVLREIYALFLAIKNIYVWRPKIIHGISPKGVLYASVIGIFFRKPKIVLSFSGLGSLYTSQSILFCSFRLIYESILSIAIRRKNLALIVQNEDDKNFLLKKIKCLEKNIFLIKGSGVDFQRVTRRRFSGRENIVLYPARVILEKGIKDFIHAAIELEKMKCDWKFVIAGEAEPRTLARLGIEGGKLVQGISNIKFVGHVENIYDLFSRTKIVCLPSFYREGLPLALVEAAAHGCVVVTTDNVGCRDAVKNGETGIIVPIKNVSALVGALDSLMSSPSVMEGMSEKAYDFALSEFNVDDVVAAHIAIYQG